MTNDDEITPIIVDDMQSEAGEDIAEVKLSKKAQKKADRRKERKGDCGEKACCSVPELTGLDKVALDEARDLYREQLKEEEDKSSQLEKFVYSIFKWFTVIAVVFVFVYMKAEGEDYAKYATGKQTMTINPYQVLGLTQSASNANIKTSYRKLARDWHPDRNPGCSTCAEKLENIQLAYKTLSDKESKAAYDKAKVVINHEKISSSVSIEVTDENINELIHGPLSDKTKENRPILLQVYNPSEERSRAFGKVWEGIGEKISSLGVTILRVNELLYPHLLRKLPVTPKVTPTVMLLNRDYSPKILPMYSASSVSSIFDWVSSSILPNKKIDIIQGDYNNWFKCNADESNQKVNMIYYNGDSKKKKPSLLLKRVFMYFNPLVKLGWMDKTSLPKNLHKDFINPSKNYLMIFDDCSADNLPVQVVEMSQLKTYSSYWNVFSYIVSHRPHLLTRRTANLLCGEVPLGSIGRNCIVTKINNQSDYDSINKLAWNLAPNTTDFSKFIKMLEKADEDDDVVTHNIINYVVFYSEENAANRTLGSHVLDLAKDRYAPIGDNQMRAMLTSEVSNSKVTRAKDLTLIALNNKHNIAFNTDEVNYVPFNTENTQSACFKDEITYLNDCLIYGEDSLFVKLKKYITSLSRTHLAIMNVALFVVIWASRNISGGQWCAVIFCSPVFLQFYLFLKQQDMF